ncbi:MAG TPA: flagellar motor protein MotB [Acidisarcina sp.]
MADEAPIIVIRKKGGHGGHHGGAWKVAYADFVTAMMALFIVLWLMSSSKPVKDAVSGYFNDPKGLAKEIGSQVKGAPVPVPVPVKKDDMQKLKAEVEKSLKSMDNFDKFKKQIEITVTPEGLRIELMEDPKGTFFETGSARPTPVLQELLQVLAAKMGQLPNKLSMEGHTDSQPFADERVYGNWELSTDRANMARRLMQSHGVRPNQVSQVRGFADQRLRKPESPGDASNRRISLIVQYLDTAPGGGATPPSASADQGAAAAAATADTVTVAVPGADPARAATSRPPPHPATASAPAAAPAPPPAPAQKAASSGPA